MEHTWSLSSETCGGNPTTSARGFRDGSVNVYPCSLVRPSRRISQMHKEVVSCFRRWHSGDVQIDGLLPSGDGWSGSPTGLRFQQVDLHHLHLLRWVKAQRNTLVSQLFQRTDAVLLCNDDPIISWRQKQGFKRMHMKHPRCDQVIATTCGVWRPGDCHAVTVTGSSGGLAIRLLLTSSDRFW